MPWSTLQGFFIPLFTGAAFDLLTQSTKINNYGDAKRLLIQKFGKTVH